MEPIRVLIADDEALVRHALRVFVDTGDDMVVVGEADDGEGAVVQAEQLHPDVVLMDLRMPRMSGIEATRRIVSSTTGVRVLAVTTLSTERHVVSALRAGASGYLVKDTEPEAILEAIREVHAGRAAISARVTRDLIMSIHADVDGAVKRRPAEQLLTPREMSIVQLIAQGRSNTEIAGELHLAEPTVKSNLGRVMAKWGVRDRVQVLIHAVSTGVIDIGALDLSST